MAQLRVDMLAICLGGLVLTSMLVATATQDIAVLSMRWFIGQGLLTAMLLGGLCWGVLQSARGLGGFIASAAIIAGAVLGFVVGSIPIAIEASVAAAALAAVLIGVMIALSFASPYEITAGALFAAISSVGGAVVAVAAQSGNPTISAVTGFGAAAVGFGVGALLARAIVLNIGQLLLRLISGWFALTAVLIAGFNHSPASIRVQAPSTPDPLAVVSLGMNEAEVERVTTALLLRLYGAFESGAETEVYDGMATAVSGESLEELHQKRRNDLARPSRNGATIKSIAMKDFDLLRSDPRVGVYRLQAGWEVVSMFELGANEHFQRNIYQADLQLEPVEGVWRLTQLNLSDGRRQPADEITRPSAPGEALEAAQPGTAEE